MVFEKPADSEQIYRYWLSEVFVAVGVVTILGKMELFWALCRCGVGIAWGVERWGRENRDWRSSRLP
jgi:hypothetical protein